MKKTAFTPSSSSRLLVAIGVMTVLAASYNRAVGQTATSAQWTPTTPTSNTWNNESTWTISGASVSNGNSPDDYTSVGTVNLTGTFTTAGTSTVTISTENTTNVGVLNIGSLAGTGTFLLNGTSNFLVMNNLGAGSTINEIATSNGDTISNQIQMADTNTTTALTINNLSAHTFTISGGIVSAGAGSNLVINADTSAAITLSTGAINNQGTITNSGTGAGTTTISAALGNNVTNVLENSAASTLSISGANSTWTGTFSDSKGNIIFGSTASTGTSTISLGSATGGNAGIFSAAAVAVTIANNITLTSGSVGTLTLGGGPTNGAGAGATLTTSGTITLNGNILNINDQGVPQFANSGYGPTVTLNGTITGSGGLNLGVINNPYSAGTVTIAGNNTGYTGTTTLLQGGLTVKTNGSALGTGVLVITPGPTGSFANSTAFNPSLPTLDAGTAGLTLTITGQVWNSDFAFAGSNSLNMGTGAVSLGNSPTANRLVSVTTNTLTVGGVISNGTNSTTPTKGIIKNGAGTLVLNGVEAYTGNTTINGGFLGFGAGATANLTAGSIVIDNGGSLLVSGAFSTGSLALSSGLINSGSTGDIALTGNDSSNLNFTGYNSLMLGAQANSTYTGVITAGSTGYHLGGGGATLTLSGANTLTGTNALTVGASSTVGLPVSSLASSTLGTASGTVKLTNSNNMSGPTTINSGALDLSSSSATVVGTLANSAVTVDNGATLAIDSTGSPSLSTISATRAASVNLNGGVLSDTTGASVTDVDTITGTLTLNSGGNTITVAPNGIGGSVDLTAAQLVAGSNGFALVNGTNLGSFAVGANSGGNITFATAPTNLFVGSTAQTTGGKNTLQLNTGILPFLVGEVNTSTGAGTQTGVANTFVTYDATFGLRPLALSEYDTSANLYAGAAAGHNVNVTTAGTVASSTSVNSLLINTTGNLSIADGQTLTDASGAILFSSAGTIAPAGTTGALAFGANKGYIYTNSGGGNISAAITGTNGFDKTGSGTLFLSGNNSGLSGTLAVLNGTASGSISTAFGATTIQLGDTGGSNSAILRLSGSSGVTTISNNVIVAGGNTGTSSIVFVNNGTNQVLTGTITMGSANAAGVVVGHNLTINLTSGATNAASGDTGAIVDPLGLTGPAGVVNIIEGTINAGNGTETEIFGNANSTYSGGTTIGYTGGAYGFAPLLRLNGGQIFGTGTLTINGAQFFSTAASTIITGTNSQVWNMDWAFTGASNGGVIMETFGMTGNIDLGNVASGTTRTITVANNGPVNGVGNPANTTDLLIAGQIQNGSNGTTDNLALNGGGNLILTANNTYTGSTTMAAGLLQLGSGGTTGGIANNTGSSFTVPTTASTLVIDRSDSQTLAGIIGNNGIVAGAGNFTIAGSGTITASAAQTYTGTTTLSGGGALDLTGTMNGTTGTALTFNTDGGTFNYDNTGSTSSVAHGMLAITPTAGENTVESTYGTSGNDSLTFSNVNARTAGATLDFVANGGTITGATPTNEIVLTQIAGAAPVGGTLLDKGYFYNGSSYASYDTTDGYVTAFNYTTGTGAATSAGGTTFGTITSATNMQLTGNITAQTTGTLNTLNIVGSNTVTLASGTLTAPGILVSGGNAAINTTGTGTLALGSEGIIRTNLSTDSLAISTAISGTALTKSGSGTLALSGANVYSGTTTLDAGTLAINSAKAIGTGTLVVNYGTTIDNTTSAAITDANNNAIRLNGDFTYGGTQSLNMGTGAVSLGIADQANRTITANGTGTLTLGGVISNGTNTIVPTTGVIKTGSGTVAFGGNNTYTGGTTVNAGTLLATNTAGSATGTGALTVGAGATIGGNGISAGSSFNISGTGTATGSRATVLAGMNSASDTNTTQILTMTGTAASTIQNANLTFNLNAGTVGQSTELAVGSTAITFGAGTQSTTLSLNIDGAGIIPPNSAYVLIAGTTTGGVDQYTGLNLGTSTVNGSVTLTQILGGGVGGNGNLTLALTGLANTYYGANSYLVLYQNSSTGADDIEVEVVPEPGTWALMFGGLAMLIFWQRRKQKN